MKPLEIAQLQFGYDQNPTLKNLNLSLKEGKLTVILGPNGSGKTTLVKLMSKMMPPDSGHIYLHLSDIMKMSQKEISKSLAIVPQNTAVEFDFTVEEIVAMGRYPHLKRFEQEGPADWEIINEAMRATDVLDFKHRPINALSGGEIQRVIIARALAQKPKILILDEPIAHLDIQHQIELLKLVKQLAQTQHITIAMILHDLNFAMAFADQVVLMHEGNIAAEGLPEDVLVPDLIKSVYGVDICLIKNPVTGMHHILPIT